MTIDTNKSKAHPSACVAEGEEITAAGKASIAARSAPDQHARRIFGQDAGLFRVPEDFDEPLSEIVAAFEDEASSQAT